MAKQELLETIRDRYQAASRKEKSRIFDEFTRPPPNRQHRSGSPNYRNQREAIAWQESMSR